MSTKLKILSAVLALFFVTAACSIQLGSSTSEPTTAPVQPLPTKVMIATAAPVATKESTAVLPTQALKPTQDTSSTTGTSDISGAILKLSDFPSGFDQLTSSDLTNMGMSEESLGKSFEGTFKSATTQNFVAFMNSNPKEFEITFSMVFYPLTKLEQTSFDLELADPTKAMDSFGASLGGKNLEIMKDANSIGDASIGFTFTTGDTSSVTIRADVIMSRHKGAVQLMMVMYQESGSPSMTAVDAAKIVGDRLDTALK